MSKPRKLARLNTEAADESINDTMNNVENEVVASSTKPEGNSSAESSDQSNDDLKAFVSSLQRKVDILLAKCRRENAVEEDQENDDEVIIVTETDEVHQTPTNNETPNASATTSSTASTSQASTSSIDSDSNNAIDDSVVLIDDTSPEPVRPTVRYDDEDVIFVTESSKKQRTIATIDLCDAPDDSFTCTRNVGHGSSRASVIVSPNKSGSSRNRMTLECPICLEMFAMDEILSTICGHLYCSPCIRNAIRNHEKCPICNRTLNANQVHRIFLNI